MVEAQKIVDLLLEDGREPFFSGNVSFTIRANDVTAQVSTDVTVDLGEWYHQSVGFGNSAEGPFSDFRGIQPTNTTIKFPDAEFHLKDAGEESTEWEQVAAYLGGDWAHPFFSRFEDGLQGAIEDANPPPSEADTRPA